MTFVQRFEKFEITEKFINYRAMWKGTTERDGKRFHRDLNAIVHECLSVNLANCRRRKNDAFALKCEKKKNEEASIDSRAEEREGENACQDSTRFFRNRSYLRIDSTLSMKGIWYDKAIIQLSVTGAIKVRLLLIERNTEASHCTLSDARIERSLITSR